MRGDKSEQAHKEREELIDSGKQPPSSSQSMLPPPVHSSSPEYAIKATLKRLFVHGKSDELWRMLQLAQIPISKDDLKTWVQLDEQEWKNRHEKIEHTELLSGSHTPQSQLLTNKYEDPISQSVESLSLDHNSLSERALLLGLENSPPPQRYKLGSELARGGVGKVLRTRDRQLNRHQVIKLLNQGTEASQKVILNFIREAQITA